MIDLSQIVGPCRSTCFDNGKIRYYETKYLVTDPEDVQIALRYMSLIQKIDFPYIHGQCVHEIDILMGLKHV